MANIWSWRIKNIEMVDICLCQKHPIDQICQLSKTFKWSILAIKIFRWSIFGLKTSDGKYLARQHSNVNIWSETFKLAILGLTRFKWSIFGMTTFKRSIFGLTTFKRSIFGLRQCEVQPSFPLSRPPSSSSPPPSPKASWW